MDVTDTTDLPPSSGQGDGDAKRDRKPKGKASETLEGETSQAESTQPRKVDPDTGLELDEYDLPLSGPARVKAMAARGLDTDPALTATENADG